MQNLLDSEVQSYQYMRALLMNPPLEVHGNVSSAQLKYAPNALWKLGSDPGASVTPAKLETASLQQFPQNYGLIKAQILALNSSSDNSTPANSGAASSKTPQGVAANQMQLGVSDNYVRRQFESWFEEVINTELNLYFAERSGVQEITLDLATADKLRELDKHSTTPGQPPPSSIVSEDNKIRIDYDSETPKLDFYADPTSSTTADNQQQIIDLQEMLQNTSTNPYIPYQLQAEGYELHLGEMYKQLFTRYGIKDIDKIITEIPPPQKDPQTGQEMPSKPPTVMTPFFDKPHLTAVYKDLPPAAQVQLLSNGGVNVTENDVLQPNIDQIAGGRLQNPVQPAYIDQQTGQITSGHPPTGQGYVDPSTGQPSQGQTAPISEHPLLQMMNTLNIKFTDLPEDSQHEVLQLLGIPTSGAPTPASVKLGIEQQNTDLKTAQFAHDQQTQAQAHTINAANTAVKVAQLQHSVNTANDAHTIAAHDSAVKFATAMQPQLQPSPVTTKMTQAQQGASK